MVRKARAATVTITDSGDPETPAGEDFADANDAERGALIQISDEIRNTAGTIVQIVRVEPRQGRGHVADMSPEEFSSEKVSELYGPGTYRIRFVGPNQRYLPGGGPLVIAPKRVAGDAAAAAPAGGMSDIKEMFALLQSQNDAREQRQREEAEKARSRWDKILELSLPVALPAIIGLFGNRGQPDLVTLLTALKPAPAPTMAEVVQTLASLKSIGSDKPPSDQLDLLARLMEFAKTMNGADGGGEAGAPGANWVDLLRDGLRAAPDILAGLRASQPQQVPVIVQPQQNPQPTLTAQPNGQQTEGDDVWKLIQPLLRQYALNIEAWAVAGKDTALRAEVLLDDLPEWLAAQLKPEKALELLNHPQWFEHLTAFHPPLAAHRAWVEKLREELIAIVTEQIRTQNAQGAPEDE